MIIPELTIQKIKDEADIVKIISEYVKLEKKGGNFIGLCPFHPDNNPSLSVSPVKKLYKCFSCGASGNVLTFIQNHENVSFVKAVQIVGDKCGIKVDIENSDDTSQNLEKYYKIMQKATNFYDFFLTNTSEGQIALNYLYKRKLNDEIIKRFQIGLAPKEADLLYKSLLNDKFQPLDMIEAGVVRSKTNYYDVFRNRITFPITDLLGNIVGFSGRIYQDNITDESKYLNSSENIIFKKGNILYNYKEALNEIKLKDQVFVFEGFLDVIAAYRAKVYNAIATMGTSLTPNQVKAIAKVTQNVVICFDGDTAGIEATKKAIQHFTDAKLNVKTVILPVGTDPDDYVNKYGEEKFNDFLNNQTISGIDYLYEIEKKDLLLSDITSVEKFKNNIFKYMNFYQSNVLRERYLQRLSEDINTSIESLNEDFKNTIPSGRIININSSDYANFQPINPIKITHKKLKFIISEKSIIKISYFDKEKCREIEALLKLKYVDKINRGILFKLYDYYTKNDIINDEKFKIGLTSEESKVLQEILNSTNYFYADIKILIEIINRYQYEKIAEGIAKANKGMHTPESLTNFAAALKPTKTFIFKETK